MAHLKEQAHRYFDAIDMSINCGDKGIVFSEHAIDLCHTLETNMPVIEILALIKHIKTEASQVHMCRRTSRKHALDSLMFG
jgi:hypothetical protein